MSQVGVFSYGSAEEGQSNGRNVARLDRSFEECLLLSLFGEDLLKLAVVDGIDTDAAIPSQGLALSCAMANKTYKTVAAALYHRRQTWPALARSLKSHSMHPSPTVDLSLGSYVVSWVCGATCTMIFVRMSLGSLAAKSRPGRTARGRTAPWRPPPAGRLPDQHLSRRSAPSSTHQH